MKELSVENLLELKTLPYDIYDDDGELVLEKGEALTPGKLLQLRYLPAIYAKEDIADTSEETLENGSDYDDFEEDDDEEDEEEYTPKKVKTKNKIGSSSDKSNGILLINGEDDPFEDIVNNKSSISQKMQLQLKSLYSETFAKINAKIDSESIHQIRTVRDKILETVFSIIDKTYRKSQLKIIGSYEKYHGLNVALLAAMLAKKMNMSDSQTADIIMGALLHDIGKTRLPQEAQDDISSSLQSTKLDELHPELGYKILKNELKLPGPICAIALEHHEKNDGSGYPLGISNDMINPYSQIVSICNVYDNMISGKTNFSVSTPQEAVKKIIELGSDWFSPGPLFSFVYMTNYYDDTPVEELGTLGTW